MLAALANCLVTVKRSTAYVLDSVAPAASHSPNRQPVRASPMQVTLAGSTPAGTVTISGTVNGAADTETLTFTGAGTKVTVKSFTAITTITTSLTGTTSIAVQAVGPGGSPQVTTYTLKSGLPVNRRVWDSQSWPVTVPGTVQKEGATFRVQYEDVWEPRQGDIFEVEGTGEDYEVVGRPRSHGNFAPDHWIVRAELRQGR